MTTLKSFLQEMAGARPADKNKIYYHGTPSEIKARAIFHNGLDPTCTVIKYGNKKSQIRPEDNSVYITPQLKYAMIFGLGGDLFDCGYDFSKDISSLGEFGYVFEIDGAELIDIGPDEDCVGELLYNSLRNSLDTPATRIIRSIAWDVLTQTQWQRVKDGNSNAFSAAGKKINKILTDDQKLLIIDTGIHISHKGKLMVSKCWKFSRNDAKLIKSDGSNFFEFASECKF